MSRASILMILGILVMLTPFSGLPISIRTLLLVIFGASIFGTAFMLRARTKGAPPEIAQTAGTSTETHEV